MIRRTLPPLNSLRAFEAAARHLSVKRAAEELCVTPGAVSQMLRNLEEHLGAQLFERVNRGICLTQAGRDYLPPIRNAFRQIVQATQRVADSVDTGVLTISVTPFFASAWLLPRLPSFQQAHPGIDLQVLTGTAPVDFSREGVDMAVRHGAGRYDGLRSHRVASVEMVPVAAPALLARYGPPQAPRELLQWPRIHDADRQGWSLWFHAQGVDEPDLPKGLAFDDSALLRSAVLAGQGAGLLPAAMVALDVDEGRLAMLARPTHMESFAYYLVYPEALHGKPKVTAMRDWMLATSSATTPLLQEVQGG